MAVFTCPKGHSSTENDYCSECGAKIDGAAKGAGPSVSGPVAGKLTCPDCGVAHAMAAGDYCEVCGFNFKTGAHGELPMPPVTAAPAPVMAAPVVVAAPTPAPAPVTTASSPTTSSPTPAPAATATALATKLLGWEVEITVDPTLKVEGSPEPPADFEPVVAALRNGSNLIGRTSPRRGIHPEVAVDHDDAISHRHALLEVHSDDTLTLRDIGSSNGTAVNGKEIAQLADVQLNDGDQVTLGHWTRLLVKAVR